MTWSGSRLFRVAPFLASMSAFPERTGRRAPHRSVENDRGPGVVDHEFPRAVGLLPDNVDGCALHRHQLAVGFRSGEFPLGIIGSDVSCDERLTQRAFQRPASRPW